MPASRHFSWIDTLELKLQIEKMLGYLTAQKYVDLLTKFLSLKVNKSDFDSLCTGTVGRENVLLHNHLLRSIIKKAQFSKTLPTKESKAKGDLSGKVPNGYQKSSLQSLCSDFLQSPCTGRSILSECKFRDHHSALGPHGKSHTTAFEDSIPKKQEQSTTELLSMCSRPPCSVEDGEEVDQAAGSPSIYSRSPIRAPLGISFNAKGARKVLYNQLASSYYMGTCQKSGELPDSNSSRKRLEHKLEMEGIKVSVDCANLLTNSLDVYLKRLMNPCMGLAGGKHAGQGQIRSVSGLKGVWPVRCIKKPGHCSVHVRFSACCRTKPSDPWRRVANSTREDFISCIRRMNKNISARFGGMGSLGSKIL